MEPIDFSTYKAFLEDRRALVEMYQNLVLPRIIEEQMLLALRQNRISKWFSSWGQEAISVGATMAMDNEDFILPMHRNLGVFTTRKIPLNRLFSQFQGKMNGFTQGRDRSFHFGTQEFKIVGMISHLGSQMGVADGIALAEQMGSKQCTLVFSGDGGASQGDFHEAVNVAAVWNLPLLIIIENNQWGLSTPSSEQFKCASFVDKGIGYGVEAIRVDGNNILAVYEAVSNSRKKAVEEQRPIIIECMTFRMRGHEEASGTKYYPEGLQKKWEISDPVSNFQNFLIQESILTQESINEIRQIILHEIEEQFNMALQEPSIIPDYETSLNQVFAPFNLALTQPNEEKKEMRMIDAIRDALDLALSKHHNLILMGQDIAAYGGVFKATEGLVETYGKERVRNTPLCEAAIVGASQGLSIKGMKAMMEFQFADFVTEGFNQIINNVSKLHWRWGQNVDIVFRMPCGGGVAAGPFHSQTNEAWFLKSPGIKVIYPSNAYQAKGLLLRAFEDPNPVMFFEHKFLYRKAMELVPQGYYTLDFGKAEITQSGLDLTIVTYGLGVHWAKEVSEEISYISMEIIDLVSLQPLDIDTVVSSVRKTHKALVLHEDSLFMGFGAELAAQIQERCFFDLDAPVIRVGSMDTPIPFAPQLEAQYMAKSILAEKILALFQF
ncbi:MAG: dehydrogenase E1 component subunit alpha/beta [Chitinophagales bacterium]|jgi:2-oxoisovalerate dehydrogenase E1 component|nr:dehydrogenase E1 component subunit alpha/beta [Chitinophagales bacterium]